MTYTYNLSGALIEQQYPSGRRVENALDATGDLERVRVKTQQIATELLLLKASSG